MSEAHTVRVVLSPITKAEDVAKGLTPEQKAKAEEAITRGLAVIAHQQTLALELRAEFLWLLGISHSAYVGGKIPNKR